MEKRRVWLKARELWQQEYAHRVAALFDDTSVSVWGLPMFNMASMWRQLMCPF
jgi:hypothetical protein